MTDKGTILLIDDDPRNTFALAAVLQARGFTSLTAECIEQAFRILDSTKQVTCILLDMMMPVMDGYEALHVLKTSERFRMIPVIAVTAQAMKGDKEKCLAAGADDYIANPIDIDLLLAAMHRQTSATE